MSSVIPVILCGGSGTRLWPLSRSDRPKQLISLDGECTLLEASLKRAGTIVGAGDPICVTAATYGVQVRKSLDRLGLRGRLLLEPEPRNTAPALAAAALVALGRDADAILVAMPADHVIGEGEAFPASIARACAAAEAGWLTILGVTPRSASSALGYIVPDAPIDDLPQVARVNRFVEKPGPQVAEGLIEGGALWNAGVLVARADAVIDAMLKYEPAVLVAVKRSLAAGASGEDGLRLDRGAFAGAPSISFDKAVLERHGGVAVTPLDAPWRDVGTWGEVAELYPPDEDGNRHRGKVHLLSSHNSFVFSPHRLTVGIGLADVVVIDTPDALLVSNRADLGLVREAVEAMVAAHHPEVSAGSLQPQDAALESFRKTFPATEVILGPGEIRRYESLDLVARHWIVLEGSIRLTIEREASTYVANQSFRVGPGIPHQLASWGGLPAKLIEVQVKYNAAQ